MSLKDTTLAIRNFMPPIVGEIAIILLLAGAVYGGWWLAQPTVSELAERNRTLAAADSTRRLQLDEWRIAYERAIYDFTEQKMLDEFIKDSLNATAQALRDDSRRKDRQIETLASSNAELRDTLGTVLSNITASDTLVTADVEARKDYEDGYIAAKGDVKIRPHEQTGDASLEFSVGMSPVVAVSRDTAGLAHCQISYGDMPIITRDIVCVNNLRPDLPARQSFWDVIPAFTVGSVLAVAGLAVAAIVVF